MCFDIDVVKYSFEDLQATFDRICMLLRKPAVFNRLPDKGYQLRQARNKVRQEIIFREHLFIVHGKMKSKLLKCASESDMPSAKWVRYCSLDRRSCPRHLKPYKRFIEDLRYPTGRTESNQELHSGVKWLNDREFHMLRHHQDEASKAFNLALKKFMVIVPDDEDSSSDEEPPNIFYADPKTDEEVEDICEIADQKELQKEVKKYVFNQYGKHDVAAGPSGVDKVEIKSKTDDDGTEDDEPRSTSTSGAEEEDDAKKD